MDYSSSRGLKVCSKWYPVMDVNQRKKDSQFKRATDAFVESLKVTDKKFVEEVLEKVKGQGNDK